MTFRYDRRRGVYTRSELAAACGDGRGRPPGSAVTGGGAQSTNPARAVPSGPLANRRRPAAGIGPRHRADRRRLHLAGDRRRTGSLRRRALHRLRYHQFRADRELHHEPARRTRRGVVDSNSPKRLYRYVAGTLRPVCSGRSIWTQRPRRSSKIAPARSGAATSAGVTVLHAERRVPAPCVRRRVRRSGGDLADRERATAAF